VRRLLANLALAVLILVVVEGACRLREDAPRYRPSASLGYELVPGDDGDERINAHGLRGVDVRPRTPGTFRVLAMGGSTTWGHKLEDDETWPVALERSLVGAGVTGAEVLNGGVSGWGLEQVVVALEERLLAELEPELVLVYSGWNHAILEDNPLISRFLRHSSAAPGPGWLRRLALVRWLDRKLEKLRDDEPVAVAGGDRAARWARAERVMVKAFPTLCARLEQACAQAGARVALVLYPGLVQLERPADGALDDEYAALFRARPRTPDERRELWDVAVHQLARAHEVIRGAGAAAGVPVLDLASRMVEALPPDDDGPARHRRWMSFFLDRAHLTAAGNAAIGESLAALLAEAGLTPAR